MEENSCYDLFTRADIIEKYCLYENWFAIEMVSCSYIPFQIFVFFFFIVLSKLLFLNIHTSYLIYNVKILILLQKMTMANEKISS